MKESNIPSTFPVQIVLQGNQIVDERKNFSYRIVSASKYRKFAKIRKITILKLLMESRQ